MSTDPTAARAIGGSSASAELERLTRLAQRLAPIPPAPQGEIPARLARAQRLMREQGIDALYLHGGTNLYYFSGLRWWASERMVAALLPAQGELFYVAPVFEDGTLRSHLVTAGELYGWEEHESPYALVARELHARDLRAGRLGIDEATPFFHFDGLRQALPDFELVDATGVTRGCRACKSPAELALLQSAKDRTLEVQRSAARILREGISVAEVTAFIDAGHRALGAPAGSSFCIVLFGEDSAIPHGVQSPRDLRAGDVVLIDTGCILSGYHSDITRSYVFGPPSARQREIWDIEHAAQAAAFAAARPGTPCADVDRAARHVIESAGLGPGYSLPGLPHRTGHGIGLDIHEGPYLVASDTTPLAAGMCFSNEPMICVPGEFGIRLEDHFHVTADGARWFTQPSPSIDAPFGDA